MGIECSHSDSGTLDSPTAEFAIRELNYTDQRIFPDKPNSLRQRHMCREKNDTKIRCHEGHRIFLGTCKMSEEFSVPGKAIASEKQSSFVYRSCCNRIKVSTATKSHCGFDITRSGPSCSARFNSRFDVSRNIIQMINNRGGRSLWKRLTPTNYRVAALEIENSGSVCQ